MLKKLKNTESPDNPILFSDEKLWVDLLQLIEKNRHQVAMQANSTLTVLFWQVGRRINDEILKNRRAEYGKQILPTLSAKLENLYGRNFTEKSIVRFFGITERLFRKRY